MPAITIDVKKGAATLQPNQQQQAAMTKESAKEQGKPSLQNQVINTAVIGYARQTISEGINQYAKLSGKYALADTANFIMSISTDALTIAKGGPAGAVAVGVKYALKAEQSYVDQMISDRNTNFLRSRASRISESGSRYYD